MSDARAKRGASRSPTARRAAAETAAKVTREPGRSEVPNPSRAAGALRDGERRAAYWQAHWRELLERYPEQFVAVYEEEVIAADSDLDRLLAILTSRHYDPKDLWVRLVTADIRRLRP